MKNLRLPVVALLVLLSFALTSCDAIEGVFKGGALFGVIGVFLVVLLLWFLVRKMRGGGPA